MSFSPHPIPRNHPVAAGFCLDRREVRPRPVLPHWRLSIENGLSHFGGLAQDRAGRSRHIPKKATVRENRGLD
jgi:hypothetical protein